MKSTLDQLAFEAEDAIRCGQESLRLNAAQARSLAGYRSFEWHPLRPRSMTEFAQSVIQDCLPTRLVKDTRCARIVKASGGGLALDLRPFIKRPSEEEQR